MIQNLTLSVLSKKIAFSTLVQFVGRMVNVVLGAVILKLISNFLSVNNYGIYASISEYALFFSVAANLGIFANIVRKMTDNPTDGKIFMNALFLRIITAGLFFALGVVCLVFIKSEGVFIIGTALFLTALFFDFITSVCDGMLQAHYLMGRATFALVIGKCVAFAAVFSVVQFDLHNAVALLFLAVLLGSMVTAALSFYFVSRRIKIAWNPDTHFMWQLFKVGLPFGIITILNSLYFRFLPDYLSHGILTPGQFATFNISFRISQVVSLASTFLMFSVLPGMRGYIDQKNWHKVKILYARIVWILLAAGVLVFIGGSLFGETILELLTHKKYFLPEFWFVFPLMLLLAAISFGYDLILITLFALNEDRWLLKREAVALSIACLFFLTSFFFSIVQIKLLFIILGAIAGETTMVILGLIKTRKVLATASQKLT